MSKFPATIDELKAAGYSRAWLRKSASQCRACQAPIEFWKTPNGKLIPLDVETYKPHWATCPEAERFRTPRLGMKS